VLRVHGHEVRLQLLSLQDVDDLQLEVQVEHLGQEQDAAAGRTGRQVVQHGGRHLATSEEQAINEFGYNTLRVTHWPELECQVGQHQTGTLAHADPKNLVVNSK